MKRTTQIFHGDARHELSKMAGDTIDLVVTSPPYADQRKSTYGGVRPDEYVDWFVPISAELLRVLKPSDTFYTQYQGTRCPR